MFIICKLELAAKYYKVGCYYTQCMEIYKNIHEKGKKKSVLINNKDAARSKKHAKCMKLYCCLINM